MSRRSSDPLPTFLRKPTAPRDRGTGPIRRLIYLGAASFLLYLLFLSDTGMLRIHQMRGNVNDLRADLAQLKEDQADYEARIEALDATGSPMLERVARERYGMIREGERVIYVIEGDTPSLDSPEHRD